MTLPIPTGRWFALVGSVGLVLIFAFLSPRLGWFALGLDLALVGLLALDLLLARRHPISAHRTLPKILHQGEKTEFTLALENRSNRPLAVIARESLSPALAEHALVRRGEIAANARATWRFDLVPRFRGEIALAPPALRVRGPLGLAWAPLQPAVAQSIKVFPQAHLEGQAGLVLRHALERRLGANPLSSRGISTELYALREYLPGDEYRNIHWKESARLNRPVTRENTWEQHQHVVILLDCGRPMASLAGVRSKFDHTLSAVLALLRVVVAQQDSASLVLFSKQIRRIVLVNRRTRSFGPVFDQVYQEHADLEESDYGLAARWCARRIPRRSLAVVCTSVLDLVGADSLASALSALALRHRPLLINLEDPGLIRHAQGLPGTSLEAFAKSSAMSIVAANQRLTARLRSRGVEVVATPASKLAIGMIQSYIDHKSRRRF